MTIIDIHAHIYPSKIAQLAVDAVRDFYTINMYGKGTIEHLLESQSKSPITHFVVHSVATTPRSVTNINNFIAQAAQDNRQFIGFGAMHQDFEDKEAEIDRAISLGLKGFKLHSDIQKINIDDPKLMEFYEMIEGRLPAILHIGDYRTDYSHPRRLKKVLRRFPKLVVNGAHFGGWSMPEIGYDCLCDENCYVDISSSMFLLGPRRTEELCELFGTDRILFGSDFPMWDPASEFEIFNSMNFSDLQFQDMYKNNACKFLGMDIS